MKITWKTEWPALLVLALMFGAAALQWSQVPARVPVHWGIDGQPNGWGPRGLGLLGMPVMAAVMYVVLTLAPFADPRHANYAAFAGAYRLLRLVLLVFLAVLQVVMIETFHGARPDMNQVMLTLLGALFVCLGALMGRLRTNWFAGIRTPWTLSSERSWSATHALGGRVFAVCGACWVALGFVHRPWAVVVAFTLLFAGMIALVVYSWVVWRDDPDRHVPGGGRG